MEGTEGLCPKTNTATQIPYRTFEDKCLVEPGGENEQLFHPTITTGIAPMAVLIYMNAAIFAGESTQRGFTSRAD